MSDEHYVLKISDGYLAGLSIMPKPTKSNQFKKELVVKYCNSLAGPFNKLEYPPLLFIGEELASAAVKTFGSILPTPIVAVKVADEINVTLRP